MSSLAKEVEVSNTALPEGTTALALHEFRFDGSILQRGFWLYVWEITPPGRPVLYYVGRTGDSSSTNAQSPFNRMGQHLGFDVASNTLRRHLEGRGVAPEVCAFRLVALGPLEPESRAAGRAEHDERRDGLAAMEKALAGALASSGCEVMNRVASRKALDDVRFAQVWAAIVKAFPQLSAPGGA
ncbi:MAG: hypothetical protein WEF50_03375 [Myxococcota bacterium]